MLRIVTRGWISTVRAGGRCTAYERFVALAFVMSRTGGNRAAKNMCVDVKAGIGFDLSRIIAGHWWFVWISWRAVAGAVLEGVDQLMANIHAYLALIASRVFTYIDLLRLAPLTPREYTARIRRREIERWFATFNTFNIRKRAVII